VDHALLVRSLERFRNLPRDRQCLVQRNRALRDPIGQRRAVDQLYRQCALFKAVNGRDVGMF
jgi:hypothetical protein